MQIQIKANKTKYCVGLLLSAALLVGCTSNDEPQTPTISSKIDSVYETVSPIEDNPGYTIVTPGELKPYEQVDIYGKMTGFIKKIYVDRGDRVKKGQLLATLEAQEVNQRYLSDKSNHEKLYSNYLFSKQAYDRLTEASITSGAVAPIELDRAKSKMMSDSSAYSSARASTAQSSQLQEYLRITAPFDGIITERLLSTGALIGTNANQPIFSIAQNNRLRLTISVPEKHASAISTGTVVNFTVSSHPGEKYTALLSRTSGMLSAQDRSLTLEFDVDNSNNKLQGGDYAQVNLHLKRPVASLWVPKKSVMRTQSGTFVIIQQADKALKRISVKEGIQLDSLSEIFGEIHAKDAVLKKPSEELETL